MIHSFSFNRLDQFILLFTFFFFVLSLNLKGQEEIAEFKINLNYNIDFDTEGQVTDFSFTDKNAWRISNSEKGKSLELFDKSDYSPKVRSPFNIATLMKRKFGSFTLDVQLKQTGEEYGHRDMCIIFGMKDPSNFYYVHLASKADEHAHNIFLVNDEPRRAIASKTTDGINWGSTWNQIRIKRDIINGLIQVYFNDMNNPIMEATDNHFEFGYIGFGSFDDTGMIDNISILTPEGKEPKHFLNRE